MENILREKYCNLRPEFIYKGFEPILQSETVSFQKKKKPCSYYTHTYNARFSMLHKSHTHTHSHIYYTCGRYLRYNIHSHRS